MVIAGVTSSKTVGGTKAGPVGAVGAAAKQPRPLFHSDVDIAADLVILPGIDERAQECVGIAGIAEPETPDAFHEGLGEALADALLENDPAGRRAFLPSVAEGAFDSNSDREIERGVVKDEEGVLPAEFALDLCPARRSGAMDLESDLTRAGEGNRVHLWVIDDSLPRAGPVTVDEVHHARR
jgi:hypothetical protein